MVIALSWDEVGGTGPDLDPGGTGTRTRAGLDAAGDVRPTPVTAHPAARVDGHPVESEVTLDAILSSMQIREYCELKSADLPETDEPRTPPPPRGGHRARILTALAGIAAQLLPPPATPDLELEPARVSSR